MLLNVCPNHSPNLDSFSDVSKRDTPSDAET